MMDRAIAVLIVSAACSGCAPMLGPPAMFPAHIGRAPFAAAPSMNVAQVVVGRWDQVVAIEPGTLIAITTSDGTSHAGRFVRAGVRFVKVHEEGTEREFARADVARVDFLAAPNRGGDGEEILKSAARGALVTGGALIVVPYLLTGHARMPPARLWAAGAVAGGVDAYQRERQAVRPRTLYISPELIAR